MGQPFFLVKKIEYLIMKVKYCILVLKQDILFVIFVRKNNTHTLTKAL